MAGPVLLTIIHEIIVLASNRSPILLLSAVLLQARWLLLIVRIMLVVIIAIRRIILPGTLIIHILPLGYIPGIVVMRLHLCHCVGSRVVPGRHASQIIVQGATAAEGI